MSKKLVAIALLSLVAMAIFYFSPVFNQYKIVDDLIERNKDARGGSDAWNKIKSLKLSGRMDIGQDIHVPYTLIQQKPNNMCIEFSFNGEITTQCSNGKEGWRSVPFRGRSKTEKISDQDFNESADAADLFGLLSDQANNTVDYIGEEVTNNRKLHKLKITLAKGAIRWLYIDDETALEVKLETPRVVGGKERLVTTLYSEWKTKGDILLSHRQDTKTDGEENSHFLTVESVELNPLVDESRFKLPESLSEG